MAKSDIGKPYNMQSTLRKTSSSSLTSFINSMGILNEVSQKEKVAPAEYVGLCVEGPPHSRVYTITCNFKGNSTTGIGRTIKEAKQQASRIWVDMYLRESAVPTIGFTRLCNVATRAYQFGRSLIAEDPVGEQEVKLALSRVSLAVAQLAMNMTPVSIGVFVVQIAVEFGYTLDALLRQLSDLFLHYAECSTQLIQNIVSGVKQIMFPQDSQRNEMELLRLRAEAAEARLDGREQAQRTIEIPEFTPQLIAGGAGAIGGCAVLVAALITGIKDFNSQKGFLRHLAEFSSKISKFKNGFYALIDMVKHFHLFVKESVLAFLGRGTPSTIVRAYESLNLEHRGERVSAETFFSMLETLNSVEGEASMGIQPDALADGKFVLYAMSKILTQNMAETYSIPPSAIAAMAEARRSMEARVKTASVKHGAKSFKFDPFCVWIAGPAGTGKSTAVNFIKTWVHTALSASPEEFELPTDDRFFFSANFTQQYHTGYNGQYIFAMDDICQDKPGLLTNSSLMFLIQSKSRIPSNVTQAALEDKLCPFDSKIILCTSNLTHPNRKSEIADEEAFFRRRDMLIYMNMDSSYDEDPILKRRVKFMLLDPMKETNCTLNPLKKFENFEELMSLMLSSYVQHFKAQKALDQVVEKSEAAEGFSKRFWDANKSESAVATMYRLPSAISVPNFVSQCKEEALRIAGYMKMFVETHLWKVVVGISTVALTGLAMYSYHRASSYRCFDVEDYDHVVPSYDKLIVRPKIGARARPTYNKELVRAKAPARAIRTSFVDAMSIKNVVKIARPGQGTMNAVFVKDRYLLTCRHFFTDMKEGEEFEITEYPQYSVPRISLHSFNPKRMVRVPDAEDAVLYEAGNEVQAHRNIVSKFFQCALPSEMDAAAIGVFPTSCTIVGTAQVLSRMVTYPMSDKGDAEEAQVRGFEMFTPTRPGRSGSVLVSDESVNRAPTIFGIQTSMSQDSSRAYFEALTRQQIERAVQRFEGESATSTMLVDCEQSVPIEMQAMCANSLIYVCKAEKPVHQMTETRLQQSVIAPDFPVDESLTEYLPSALKDKTRQVDVLKLSMAGFDRKYGCVNTCLVDEVLEEFQKEDRAERKCRNLDPRLLTNDEVLNGLHGYGLKGVETKTSPGLPLVHMKDPGKPGKETWITRDSKDQRILCEEQWKIFNEHEAMIRQGEQPPYLAYACLKDELRPAKHVRALKTRSFIILPMIMNLLIRKYFGMWIAVQHKLHNTISSSVGIDVNTEWTTLKQRLLNVGNAIEDFDYTDWDRSLHAEWFRLYADRVSAWYKDRRGSPGWRARRTLMDILSHMPIQIGDHVVQTSGGNKSGCAITAEVNSDVHDMLMLYVWKRICRMTGRDAMANLLEFRKNVALALYGDDVVKSTSHGVAEWFNGNAISEEVAKLGMVITPGNKTDTEFKIKTIEEVTFLKRSFLTLDEDCGLVRAPLNKAVIQRMMLWVHKSDQPQEACEANVKGALCEASFWGRAFYDEMYDKVEMAWKAMEAHGKPMRFPTYDTIMYNWTNRVRSEILPAQFQFSDVGGLELSHEMK